MPGKSDMIHRIRVRVLDDRPCDQKALNKLKSNELKMPHLHIHDAGEKEFIICAKVESHIEQVREKLNGVRLEEVPDGDTTITMVATEKTKSRQAAKRTNQNNYSQHNKQRSAPPGQQVRALKGKPFSFVALPDSFTTESPVWHDGTDSAKRLSGEVRFELQTLTPLLVGWERGQVGDLEGDWPVPKMLNGVKLTDNKSLLCPLRAPWGRRPVIIPGDSLKGLLRQELGALLGAPMERVAERTHSYRPNALFTSDPDPRLVARLARIPDDGITIDEELQIRLPTRLELLPLNLKYDDNNKLTSNYYRFNNANGAPYRGGLGAGERLNSKARLYERIDANLSEPLDSVQVEPSVQEGYLATVKHLVDLDHGHFCKGRHPDVPKVVTGSAAKDRILHAAGTVVFQPGDLIWVEWDIKKNRVVSLGWHYYYRWAYTDSVRVCRKGERKRDAGGYERHGLFPLPEELRHDNDGAPMGLSAIRRLFGYTGDSEGSAGIGEGDYAQLMGRVFPNAALEVVNDSDTEEARFIPQTFLKELGMPRPSAVEHYLQQPYHPDQRPDDRATLMTYGDAVDYDSPGELAGRKFYLDRMHAVTNEPWKDDSSDKHNNELSTLALEASKPNRKFRFTLRFRDLDSSELAAILVALCPNQFKDMLGGDHSNGYCSKLGYARPLGWGSVRIEARALLWLDTADDPLGLQPETNLLAWVRDHHQMSPMQKQWLGVHRHEHPDAHDYPTGKGSKVYNYHSALRAAHSRSRRYSEK